MSAEISLIVPVYNELKNFETLVPDLIANLEPGGEDFEIVFVDDGSDDGSAEHLAGLAAEDPRLKLVQLRRNFGQTAAMPAGSDHAAGDVLFIRMGLVAELLMRTYYDSQGKRPYLVRRTRNCAQEEFRAPDAGETSK
ncbi:MAG: glycosyltransferase [Acidobacteria bacterium]|nr:glycosyltransferase [Acidobacteriota bacterium]